MRSTLSVFTLALAALPSLVSAHGFVAIVTVNGKDFKGDVPQGPSDPTAIRQISDVSPVKGAMNPDVNCGMSAKVASQVIDMNPGDKVEFDWRGGDMSFWPHNTGPMLTYMASCGDTTCDKFDSTKARWFKIQEVGRKDSNPSQWAQQDLMSGKTAAITLPSVKPGNYLLRHEIIALHLATQKGGAEFYPSCTQVRVGGNGAGVPKDNELVSLPGAYTDDDPGIFYPDTFNPSSKYPFPGPAIASFITSDTVGSTDTPVGSGSGSGSNSGSGSGPSKSGSASASSATGKASSSTSTGGSKGSCRLKKAAAKVNARAVVRPRHLSRIMRGITIGHSAH
ncbi:hypothetical protein HGRIS_014428 [Hohenbuehelia grisea]|uniref:lytic cellulose monooxygenase (C4-dehydrogenating) n=1 Tax=Hohenbuehelia grisea TaxID=104357 RepID=A0ABR3JVK7_9AGAR